MHISIDLPGFAMAVDVQKGCHGGSLCFLSPDPADVNFADSLELGRRQAVE